MGAAVSSLPPLSATVIAQVTAEYQRVQLQHPSSTTSQRRAHRSSSSARLSFSASQRSASISLGNSSSPYLPSSTNPPATTPSLPPLTLDQLLHFHLPPHLPLSLCHLSTLYCLSLHSPDGSPLTLAQLLDFLHWCDAKASEWLRAERQSKLEALFSLKMAYDAQRLGEQWLVQWLCGLIAGGGVGGGDGGQQRHGGGGGGVHGGRLGGGGAEGMEFVHRDAVMAGYELLRPYLPSDLSFQELFDSLQHVAEQHNLLELDDASLDDYIPISVLQVFASYFVYGFLSLFAAMGLQQSTSAFPTAATSLANTQATPNRSLNPTIAPPLSARRGDNNTNTAAIATNLASGSGSFGYLSGASSSGSSSSLMNLGGLLREKEKDSARGSLLHNR